MEQGLLTLLDDGETREISARRDGERVYLDPDALRQSLGWKLEDAGLCRAGTCVPVRNRGDLLGDAGIELGAFAEVLGRPIAVEASEWVAALGTGAAERGRELLRLEAPDFELPDLSGKLHSLSQYRGKKILLFMHASW
jgi:hypothetical protein